jgi:hypothetical protein
MTSRIVFESWQLLFPAIGIMIFIGVFVGAAVRAWRMRPPRIRHLENLPLEEESSRPVTHGRHS